MRRLERRKRHCLRGGKKLLDEEIHGLNYPWGPKIHEINSVLEKTIIISVGILQSTLPGQTIFLMVGLTFGDYCN